MNTWRKIEAALAVGALVLVATVVLRPPAPPTRPSTAVARAAATATPGTPRPTVTRQPTLTPTPPPPTPAPWPTPTPSPTPPVPRPIEGQPPDGDWVVMLARKSVGGTRVFVEEIRYPSGVTKPAFEYEELVTADNSGNQWRSLPPSVSLSADSRKAVVATADGLTVYDLAAREKRLLLRRTNPLSSEMAAQWDPPLPRADPGTTDRAFAVYAPRWSADGTYVSAAVAYYEGGGLVIVRVADGAVVAHGFGDARGLRWSESGASALSADCFYECVEEWLTVREPPSFTPRYLYGDVIRLFTGAEPWPPAPRTTVSSVGRAAWSPDGRLIAFIGTPPRPIGQKADPMLGLLAQDSAEVRWLTELHETFSERHYLGGWPMFDRGGTRVYFANPPRSSAIWSADLHSGELRAHTPALSGFQRVDPIRWLDDHSLMVTVHTHGFAWSPTHSQVVTIDITTGEVRPITGLLPPYTSVLSVERLP